MFYNPLLYNPWAKEEMGAIPIPSAPINNSVLLSQQEAERVRLEQEKAKLLAAEQLDEYNQGLLNDKLAQQAEIQKKIDALTSFSQIPLNAVDKAEVAMTITRPMVTSVPLEYSLAEMVPVLEAELSRTKQLLKKYYDEMLAASHGGKTQYNDLSEAEQKIYYVTSNNVMECSIRIRELEQEIELTKAKLSEFRSDAVTFDEILNMANKDNILIGEATDKWERENPLRFYGNVVTLYAKQEYGDTYQGKLYPWDTLKIEQKIKLLEASIDDLDFQNKNKSQRDAINLKRQSWNILKNSIKNHQDKWFDKFVEVANTENIISLTRTNEKVLLE